MKIKIIMEFIVIVIVGFSLNKLIPSGIKEEAINLSFKPPIIFIWMGFFLIFAIILFWGMIKIHIPAVFGGNKGMKESNKNKEKFIQFFKKLIFWKKEEVGE